MGWASSYPTTTALFLDMQISVYRASVEGVLRIPNYSKTWKLVLAEGVRKSWEFCVWCSGSHMHWGTGRQLLSFSWITKQWKNKWKIKINYNKTTCHSRSPGISQICWSCHSSKFWHFQMIPVLDWLQESDNMERKCIQNYRTIKFWMHT